LCIVFTHIGVSTVTHFHFNGLLSLKVFLSVDHNAGFSIRARSRWNLPAFSHELNAYLIEKLPHTLWLTWETWYSPQNTWHSPQNTSIRSAKISTWKTEESYLSWILSNSSGDSCVLFCSNTLILAPECRKCILQVRGPNFQNFPGEHTPVPHYNLVPLEQVAHSQPTPKILPPTQIPIENLLFNVSVDNIQGHFTHYSQLNTKQLTKINIYAY